ncbi:MAG TPA: nuclear transport factor 2 family protein [Anaeromyxobacteraceae bacterium]
MSRDEIEVLDVNDAFYAAFAARDLAALEALWARETPVACVHPGWNALRGREAVMASWRAILGGDPPDLRCSAATAHVAGGVAYVVCQERLPRGPALVATNLFVREGGRWQICHHHAGPLFEQVEEPAPGARA